MSRPVSKPQNSFIMTADQESTVAVFHLEPVNKISKEDNGSAHRENETFIRTILNTKSQISCPYTTVTRFRSLVHIDAVTAAIGDTVNV